MHVCVYVYMCVCVCIHVYACVHVYMHIFLCGCKCICGKFSQRSDGFKVFINRHKGKIWDLLRTLPTLPTYTYLQYVVPKSDLTCILYFLQDFILENLRHNWSLPFMNFEENSAASLRLGCMSLQMKTVAPDCRASGGIRARAE